MFQTEEEIARRTPKGSLDRLSYIQQLVTEFQTTDSNVCKQEVLANLGNFAYDPLNFGHLRQLNVADLFLDMLAEDDEKLVEFGVAGVCNLALDKDMKKDIIESDGVSLVQQCLSSKNPETVLSAITCLMFLMTPSSKKDICSSETLTKMADFCRSGERRLSNLAHVFFEDYCTAEQRDKYLKEKALEAKRQPLKPP